MAGCEGGDLMRDYGKVSPQFWIGRTGKALRGNAEAQLLALYLMTSPHANMIGVYHCPIAYMAHETGLTIEGASKALQSLIKADFCTFDEGDEYVFVHQFALHQVGESLLSSDKRCKGIENELAKVPKNQCWQAFRARYAVPYNLPSLAKKEEKQKPLGSPLEAPSKPETETEAETEEGTLSQQAAPARPDAARGSRLPTDWALPDDWKTWAEGERPDLQIETVADSFRDFWVSKPGKDGRKSDWQATWRNWIRSQKSAVRVHQFATSSSLAGAI